MAYKISITEHDDGTATALCDELGISVNGDSRTDAQNKLAGKILEHNKSDVKGEAPNRKYTVELRPHEIEALRTVLGLVLDGVLDHILYPEEEEEE